MRLITERGGVNVVGYPESGMVGLVVWRDGDKNTTSITQELSARDVLILCRYLLEGLLDDE